MMDNHNYSHNNNWRKQKENNSRRFNQMGACSRPRSHNSRRSTYGWQPSSWEKKFCANAGVPWQKVLETKKYMHQDDKVLQWNDSAVKEAFLNAKERFWAKIHGQPCDIKLPDPNIFIDEVNWESNVDPELILDLEKMEPNVPCETEKRYSGVVVGIPVVEEQYLVAPSGWGDEAEEGNPQPKNCEPHDDIGNDNWGGDNDVIKGGNAFSREQKDGYVFWTRNGAHGGENRDNNGYDHWDDYDVNKGRKTFSRDQFVTRNGASGGEYRDNGSTWYRNKKGRDHGYNKRWDHGDGHGGWNTSEVQKLPIPPYNGNDQSLVHDYGNKRVNFSYDHSLVKSRPVTRRW